MNDEADEIAWSDDGEDEFEGYECSKCEAEVHERDRFCWNCGRRLDPLAGCSQCGSEVLEGDRFCRQCGSLVGDSSPSLGEVGSLDDLLSRAREGVLPFIKGPDAARLAQLVAEAEEEPTPSVVKELGDVLDRYTYL